MTVPIRHGNLAVEPSRPSHAQTQLLQDERDRYLIEAARFYPGSDREMPRRLRAALSIYRDGRWRRDRSEALCPPRLAGRLDALLWMILKVRDHVPDELTYQGGAVARLVGGRSRRGKGLEAADGQFQIQQVAGFGGRIINIYEPPRGVLLAPELILQPRQHSPSSTSGRPLFVAHATWFASIIR